MMKSILSWTITFTFMSLTVSGCYYPEEDSCNIKTSGIYAQYSVNEKAGEAYVQAVFWTGDTPGGTNLELGACGDRVEVNGRKLNEQGDQATRYEAFIPKAETYVFTFVRPDEGVYESAARQIPAPIHIISPVANAIPRTEPLEVRWENNSNANDRIVQMGITGSCINGYVENIADDGQHTIAPGRLNVAGNLSCCTAQLALTRRFRGSISPELKGTFTGTVQSVAYFDSLAPVFSDTSGMADTAETNLTEVSNIHDTP